MSDYQTYLNALRRIPDDVVLSMATRPIDLDDPYQCVCGWAARELVARERNVGAEECADIIPTLVLASRLGQDANWYTVNGAAAEHATGDALEEAFVERVLEAVG